MISAFFLNFLCFLEKKRLPSCCLGSKLGARIFCVLTHIDYSIMANPPNSRGPRPQQRNNNAPRGNASLRGGARPASSVPVRQKKADDDGEGEIELEGVVSAVLAGTMFRVKVANGHEFLAHISGKMRKRFIRLVVGDRVKIEVSPYDMSKARITFRLN